MIKFFCIQEASQPFPFQEMQFLTPEQAVQAIAHSAIHGGMIEIYVGDNDHRLPCVGGMPLVGFVFQGGVYLNHGLGSDETRALEEEASQHSGEPMIGFDGDGKVNDPGPWLDFFKRADLI